MSNDALEWGVIVKKIFFTAAFMIVMLLSFLNVNAAQLYYNDEYHYYVKAVPKIAVSAPDVKVQRIYTRKTAKTEKKQEH